MGKDGAFIGFIVSSWQRSWCHAGLCRFAAVICG